MVYIGQLRKYTDKTVRSTLTVVDIKEFNSNTYILVNEVYSKQLSSTYTITLEALLENTYPLVNMEEELGKL